ncbi:hypothetical protein GQ42DRAFT_23073 [Ramicandelaber brevisporus]|nr:hypothetical protein GQ42DRAFT_23073 [Ramicandelaber brevisporus]
MVSDTTPMWSKYTDLVSFLVAGTVEWLPAGRRFPATNQPLLLFSALSLLLKEMQYLKPKWQGRVDFIDTGGVHSDWGDGACVTDVPSTHRSSPPKKNTRVGGLCEWGERHLFSSLTRTLTYIHTRTYVYTEVVTSAHKPCTHTHAHIISRLSATTCYYYHYLLVIINLHTLLFLLLQFLFVLFILFPLFSVCRPCLCREWL